MSKRNFIITIVVLVIIVASIFGYLYLKRSTVPPANNGGANFLSQFNPFGQNPTPANPNKANNTPGSEQPTQQNTQFNLLRVSSVPVAGYTVYQKERYKEVPVATTTPDQSTLPAPAKTPTPPVTEFVLNLRYVARATGNIYQTFADKVDERKFSSTVVPKIYESFFGNKGESVVMRFLRANERTIATFAGNLPKEFLGIDSTDTNEVKGGFLPDNISDMSVSPDSTKIFYLLNVGDTVAGITASPAGDKKVQVFDSPFTEWLSQWPNTKMITLTTKASGNVAGYMYTINPDKKDFGKIFGGINGLTTLTSPDGKLTLYGDNNLSLNIYNVGLGEISPVTVKTLPEKCVWNKTSSIIYCAVPKFIDPGLYPDAWYQGEATFSDDIWKIDVFNGTASLFLDPSSIVVGGIDGIKLSLDENENYLFLVNKKDSFLWEVKLK